MYWYFTGYKILSVDEGGSMEVTTPKTYQLLCEQKENSKIVRFTVIMCAILYQSQVIKQNVILSIWTRIVELSRIVNSDCTGYVSNLGRPLFSNLAVFF